jgi:hypothetical protein
MEKDLIIQATCRVNSDNNEFNYLEVEMGNKSEGRQVELEESRLIQVESDESRLDQGNQIDQRKTHSNCGRI